MTVSALLDDAVARLRGAGVPTPELDAELLLRHVMQWDRARVVSESRTTLGASDEARFRALVEERATRKPLQHLTGRQWFWKHEFVVTPDVLIPRPETELIVETSLDLLRPLERPTIVDVGTGRGCIELSLGLERAGGTSNRRNQSAAPWTRACPPSRGRPPRARPGPRRPRRSGGQQPALCRRK